MLGVNQGMIMVLAVVVIAGLVGSGALGYDVAQGLQQSLFGQGVLASLAILALGIALDRVTQGTAPQADRGLRRETDKKRRQDEGSCRRAGRRGARCRVCGHGRRGRQDGQRAAPSR